MEYFLTYPLYLMTSVLTTKLLIKNEDVINIGKTFAQGAVISVGILVITTLLMMIRAFRVCEPKANDKGEKTRSWGFGAGISASIFAIIFGMVIFVIMHLTQFWINIITIIVPFLSNWVELIRGAYVAFLAFLGCLFGRLFVSLC